jgi:biopolymer transport protein ExbB
MKPNYLILLVLFTCVGIVHGQEAARAPSYEKTLWNLYLEGGWVMLPLLLLSLWVMVRAIECLIRIQMRLFCPKHIVDVLKGAFERQDYREVENLCGQRHCLLSNVLLPLVKKPRRSLYEETFHQLVLRKSSLFQKKIRFFAFAAFLAPLLGFIGTINGLMNIFRYLGYSGIADPSMVAAGVGEILISMLAGLVIGTVSFILYYFFTNRLTAFLAQTEDLVENLVSENQGVDE